MANLLSAYETLVKLHGGLQMIKVEPDGKLEDTVISVKRVIERIKVSERAIIDQMKAEFKRNAKDKPTAAGFLSKCTNQVNKEVCARQPTIDLAFNEMDPEEQVPFIMVFESFLKLEAILDVEFAVRDDTSADVIDELNEFLARITQRSSVLKQTMKQYEEFVKTYPETTAGGLLAKMSNDVKKRTQELRKKLAVYPGPQQDGEQ